MPEEANVTTVKRILERRRNELQRKYHVNQIGVGYKIERGKMTKHVAIIFYVQRKKTREELASEGMPAIPIEIEGCATDVVEVPAGFRPRKESDSNNSRV